MSKVPYVVGGRPFATKTELAKHVQGLLHRAALGEELTTHYTFLCDLLARHPDASNKLGCGIDRFWVEINKPYATRGFHFKRVDGVCGSFSYRECLSPSTHKQDVRKAARHAVRDQIAEFRAQALATGKWCALSGRRLTPTTIEIDHVAPRTFDAIFVRWRKHVIGLSYSQIVLSHQLVPGPPVLSPEHADSFSRWHASKAVLRALHTDAHKIITHKKENK